MDTTIRRSAPYVGVGAAATALSGAIGPAPALVAGAGLLVYGEPAYAGAMIAGALLGALLRPSETSPNQPPVVPGATVLSPFGRRSTGNGGSQFHLGVDLRAPEGTPIYAAHAGTVVGAYPDGRLGGYGNTVVIDHETEPTAALYAHMQSIAPGIERGAHVEEGQLVGFVGKTNSASGFTSSPAHLHLEIFLVTARDRTSTPTEADRTRSFTSFHGGEGWFPDRADPEEWARERGIALMG